MVREERGWDIIIDERGGLYLDRRGVGVMNLETFQFM